MNLNNQLTDIFRTKKQQKDALARLELFTIKDLLYHFPTRFENCQPITFSETNDKKEVATNVVVQGTIKTLRMRRTMGKRRVMVAEASIQTENGLIKAVWFSQPYIVKQFKIEDVVSLSGKYTKGKTSNYLTNPDIKRILKADISTLENDNLVAIYKECSGITSKWIRAAVVKILLDEEIKNTSDSLPSYILKKLNLPDLYTAFVMIHTPKSKDQYEVAYKRFNFEYMFLMQLTRAIGKRNHAKKISYPIKINEKESLEFLNTAFDFKPTKTQIKIVKEIVKDLNKPSPMIRLLEGDVGSGKTAIAAAVINSVINASNTEIKISARPQIAYMVPTEILAKQIFDKMVEIYKGKHINIALLTSKTVLKYPSKINKNEYTKISKVQLKKWITNGEIPIVIGTHALIQKELEFKYLSLVIIDEQHKFGVMQRKEILDKDGYTPHLLSMTATPIPRSLALTIYGDLDLSILDEMPKGRKTVITNYIKEKEKSIAYKHIEKEIAKKRQAYVVCPRIFKTEKSDLKSVDEEMKKLKKEYPNLLIKSIHGKLTAEKKLEVMNNFLNKKIDILIATTVIEVGIDVVNANNIVILHAERFGLSQLHQLRGRVLRGSHQPYCFIVSDTTSEQTIERLKLFEKISDGFELAKQDFQMRGAGEFLGKKQSGFTDLLMTSLTNKKLVEISKKEVNIFLSKNPELVKYKELKERVKDMTFHYE